MATIDRFVSLMFEKQGTALILESDKPVMLEIQGSRRPATKDAVPAGKLLALIKEIMPQGMQEQLDAGDGRLVFGHEANGHRVDVETLRSGPGVTMTLTPAKPRRSTAAMSMPAEALLMNVPAAPPAPAVSAPRTSQVSVDTMAKAEERLQGLLRYLVESQSSDLHLRVGLPPTYRTNGELEPHGGTPLARDDIESMILSIMPDRNKAEYAETNDTDYAYEILDLARFRVNALRDRMGPAAVFRVIPTKIVTVEELGLSPEVQKLCYLTKGLVVVTGPTGSGKSTTLAAMVDLINRTRTDHIITIEDPIEFVHPNKKCVVTQRQVGSHTQSFKRALRAALREDPDIVLIGEMRDLETIQNAITVAETGHLVFATLHTNNAVQTIDRIIDVFPPHHQPQVRTQLSFILEAVISQALMPRVGGGRVLGLEIMIPTHAIRNLIRENKTHQMYAQMQMGQEGTGMLTMNQSLARLVKENAITFEEGLRRAIDQEEFLQLTGRTHPRAGARAAGVTGSSPRG